MKKSSRDYRRNNRKKWIRINYIKLMTALTMATSACRMATITASTSMAIHEKVIAMAHLSMITAQSIAKITNSPNLKTD